MNSVCYFEIPADDVSRAQSFYGQVFGWSFSLMDNMSPEAPPYWTIQTQSNGQAAPPKPESSKTSENCEPQQQLVCGGMMSRHAPGHTPSVYVDVDDIEAYQQKVVSAGGQVLMPKQVVKGMGYFAVCMDSERNTLGLWQTDDAAN